MLDERGLPVLVPERTVATADHIVPSTRTRPLPYLDREPRRWCPSSRQRRRPRHPLPGRRVGAPGIVHVVGPELGLTQPGMTSPAATRTRRPTAPWRVAFGIGTTQVRDVLATQTWPCPASPSGASRSPGRWGRAWRPRTVLHLIRTPRRGRRRRLRARVRRPRRSRRFARGADDAVHDVDRGRRPWLRRARRATEDYLRGRRSRPRARVGRAVRRLAGGAVRHRRHLRRPRPVEGAAVEPMVTWGLTPEQPMAVGEAVRSPGRSSERDGRTGPLHVL